MKIIFAFLVGTLSLSSFAQVKNMDLVDLFATGNQIKATVTEPQGFVIEANSDMAIAGRCILVLKSKKDVARVLPKGRSFLLKDNGGSETLLTMNADDDKSIQSLNISRDYPVYKFSDLNCAAGIKFEIVPRENLEEI